MSEKRVFFVEDVRCLEEAARKRIESELQAKVAGTELDGATFVVLSDGMKLYNPATMQHPNVPKQT